MRSFALLLTLAATPVVLAAPPNYSSPLRSVRAGAQNKPQIVTVTFRNSTLETRELHIGSNTYSVPYWNTIRINVPVGRIVTVTSIYNNKVHNILAEVTAADQGRTIVLE